MFFRVLGEVQVVGPDGPVILGGLRQRRLLARLLSGAPEVVQVGALYDALWPDGPMPEHPDRALWTCMARLRRSLSEAGAPASMLTTRDGGYLLGADPSTYDAQLFTELMRQAALLDRSIETRAGLLQRALAMWDGPAFGDIGDEAALRAEARRLEELRLVASEELAACHLTAGDGAMAVADLELLVARNPLRERLRRLLMEALATSGRHGEALRVFEEYRRLLSTELGLDPSVELTNVQAKLLVGDPIAPPDLVGGRPLHGYRLRDRIGEGAFSVVYRATQPSVGRSVAVKVIRAELANRPEFIRRFEAEARMIAHLEHPCIVPIYDFWREPGRAYLVMRILPGGSLEHRIDEGPRPFDEALRLLGDVGSALSAAHRAGVVHRDVRPANILLDNDGHAYLSDFGIALDTSDVGDPDSALSPSSPAYAAPEQIRREQVGLAADIFSLGITAFEMLAGRLPYANSRDAATLLHRQLTEPLPSLRADNPHLPIGIDAVLARATAKDPADRFRSVTEFTEAVRALDVRPQRSEPTEHGPNPYKGLRAFQEADAADFYGRSRLIDELVQRLAAGRFLALVGASGSGKSSVVRAGLLPALRHDAVAGSKRWQATQFVPGKDPFAELVDALTRLSALAPEVIDQMVRSDKRGLLRALRAMNAASDSEILIVVDQFEEIFTLCPDDDVRDRFLDSLTLAVAEPAARVRLVITLRADLLDRPMRHGAFAKLLKHGTVLVTPLAPDELEHAIVDPAAAAGVGFEAGVVAEIVADVANRSAALPLLQYSLAALFEQATGSVMTLADYRAMGGASGALAAGAEALVGRGGEPMLKAAQRLFARLVAVDASGLATRRRVERSELVEDRDGTTADLLDRLGKARLVTFDRDPITRGPTVEIAHEALLRQWPRLAGWIVQDSAGLRLMRSVTDAAVGWHTRGRKDDELYPPTRLAEALSWDVVHPGDFNALEIEFLDASAARHAYGEALEQRRFADQVRANRRLRVLLATVAAVALVAASAGVVAAQQRRHATRNAALASQRSAQAEVRRLGSEAAAQAGTSPQVALLLASEAYQRQPGAEGLGALQRTMTGTANFLGVVAAQRRVRRVQWLDAIRLVVAGDDGVAIYDTETGAAVLDWPNLAIESTVLRRSDGSVMYFPLARFTPTLGALVVPADPNAVRLLPLAAGTSEAPRLAHSAAVQDLRFSPDMRTLATIDSQGWVRAFDTGDGRELWAVHGFPERYQGEMRLPAGVQPNVWGHPGIEISSGRHVLSFNSDGTKVVTFFGAIQRSWDAASGTPIGVEHVLTDNVTSPPMVLPEVLGATVGPGNVVAVASSSQVLFYDLATGLQVGHHAQFGPTTHEAPVVTDLAFSDNDEITAMTVSGQLATVAISGPRAPRAVATVGLADPAGLAISPNGRSLAVATGQGVGLWSRNGDGLLARGTPRLGAQSVTLNPSASVMALADGSSTRLVAAPQFGPVDLRLAPIPVPVADRLPSRSGAFAYVDGASLLVGLSNDGNYRTIVSDATTGLKLGEFPSSYWSAVALSPDRRFIVFGDKATQVFDIATGRSVGFLSEVASYPRSLSYSPDGTRLAVAENGRAGSVYDTTTWRLVSPIGTTSDGIVAVRYSPDGSTLATIDRAGSLMLRDPVTMAARQTLLGSSRGSLGDAPLWFSRDGRYALSGNDGEGRLWDLQAGLQVGGPFPNDDDFELDGNDGLELVTGIGEHVLRWNLDPTTWPAIACQAAGRNLTADEWRRFGPPQEPYHRTCAQWPTPADR